MINEPTKTQKSGMVSKKFVAFINSPELRRYAVEHLFCGVNITRTLELTDAGRAGDIELGHEVADDVDPREQQASIAKHGADLLADPQVAIRERPDFCLGAGGQIAAVVVWGRDSNKRHGDRLAIDQQDPFVTRANDLRNVLLHHDVASTLMGDGFQNHIVVAVLRIGDEHRLGRASKI